MTSPGKIGRDSETKMDSRANNWLTTDGDVQQWRLTLPRHDHRSSLSEDLSVVQSDVDSIVDSITDLRLHAFECFKDQSYGCV